MKKHIITFSIAASLIITLFTSCMTPLDGMPMNDKDFTRAVQFFDNGVCNYLELQPEGSVEPDLSIFCGKIRVVGNTFSIIDEGGENLFHCNYVISGTNTTSNKNKVPTKNGYTDVVSIDAVANILQSDTNTISGKHPIVYMHTKAYDKLLVLIDGNPNTGFIKMLEIIK